MYAAGAPFPIYCSKCWWSDKWDAGQFSMEYDAGKSFLEQFAELMDKVPHEAAQAKQSVNSEFSNYTMHAKDAYLSFIIFESENVLYSRFLIDCKDCVDCSLSTKCANCVRVSRGGFNADCSDSMVIEYCQNVHFTYDSIHLSDCYGCINLHHKKYHIFNKPYSKEEYEKEVAKLRSLPWEEQKKKVEAFFKTRPHRGYIHYFSNNVSGEEIYYSENCKHSFLANFVRDSAYIFSASSLARSNEATHDLYDCALVADMSRSYEMIGGSKSYQCRFGIINDNSVSVEYSLFCYGATNLFGCFGLRSKKYCILNKEYTKEGFNRLRKEIVKTMPSYGEFFPVSMSPFAYNETLAQEYFPLTKKEALRKGYVWKEPEEKGYAISLLADQLPPRIEGVDDSILKETIACEHEGRCNEQCSTAFRIIPQELHLYRKMGLSLPRLCPNCRHFQRVAQRNPLALFDTHCRCGGASSGNGVYQNIASHFHGTTPCPNEFKTVFPRDIITYCRSCYNSEAV